MGNDVSSVTTVINERPTQRRRGQRRSESRASTARATVRPSVSRSRRSKSSSTPSTRAPSAVRSLSSAPTLASGSASLATNAWLAAHTPSPPRLLPRGPRSGVCVRLLRFKRLALGGDPPEFFHLHHHGYHYGQIAIVAKWHE